MPELAGLGAVELATHPLLVDALRQRLQKDVASASLRVERLLLMAEPPSMDANEIADKGYVNQATTRSRRAHLVDDLFRDAPPAHVACAH
jgi:feruloyl-CoA synthase